MVFLAKHKPLLLKPKNEIYSFFLNKQCEFKLKLVLKLQAKFKLEQVEPNSANSFTFLKKKVIPLGFKWTIQTNINIKAKKIQLPPLSNFNKHLPGINEDGKKKNLHFLK